MTKEELEKLIKQMNSADLVEVREAVAKIQKDFGELSMKAIFPNANSQEALDQQELKTFAETVINPEILSVMTQVQKSYAPGDARGNAAIGAAAVSGPGLFKSVSPAMYQFGVLLKGWNKARGASTQFNLSQYEELCTKNAKAFGMKAATYNGEAVNADGGFTVPIEFGAIVIEFAIATSPILSQVWRVPMSSSEIRFPKLSQGENGNYFGGVYMTCNGIPAISEGTIGTGTKTRWEQNIFNAKKIAGHTAITEELQQDSIMNILNYMAALYIRAFQYKLEQMIIAGNGTNEFLGITKDPIVIANAVARKAANKVSGDDFINLEGAVDEAFGDDKLSWLTRRATVAKVRAERVNVDGTGEYLVRESWAERQATQILTKNILGHPYHVTRNVPAIGSTGDVIIGDMSMYMLATRMDMRIDISDAPYWLENETAMRMIARMDGMPGTSYAFKILKSKSAS